MLCCITNANRIACPWRPSTNDRVSLDATIAPTAVAASIAVSAYAGFTATKKRMATRTHRHSQRACTT